LRQCAFYISVLKCFSIFGVGFSLGTAEDGVYGGEEFDGCWVPTGGGGVGAGGGDLVGGLGGDEAADVDCFGVFGGEGLADFGGAGLEEDALVIAVNVSLRWWMWIRSVNFG
jgi:hypothetical protein